MIRLVAATCVTFALMSGVAAANDVVVAPVYTPLVGPVYSSQTVYYAPAAPVAVAPAPVVTYRPTIVSAPAPVIAYSPVAPPVVAYSPVAPAPVAVAPAPVVYTVGRPVVVSTKVYVPGQPIRNFFKAITP